MSHAHRPDVIDLGYIAGIRVKKKKNPQPRWETADLSTISCLKKRNTSPILSWGSGDVLGWKMVLEDVHTLVSGTCECYLEWQRNSAEVIRVKILRWGVYPGLSRWAWDVTTGVLWEGGRSQNQTEGMWPQKKRDRKKGMWTYYAFLLPLKMETGATSQRMYEASGSWNSQGNRFSPESPKRMQCCGLILDIWLP